MNNKLKLISCIILALIYITYPGGSLALEAEEDWETGWVKHIIQRDLKHYFPCLTLEKTDREIEVALEKGEFIHLLGMKLELEPNYLVEEDQAWATLSEDDKEKRKLYSHLKWLWLQYRPMPSIPLDFSVGR